MADTARYHSLDSEIELANEGEARQKAESRKSILRIIFQERDGHRRRWLPWLTLVFGICAFFTFSMIYAVADIAAYKTHHTRYLITTWSIFAIPSIILAFLVLTPFPSSLRQLRHQLGSKKPPPNFLPTINALNALSCVIAIVVYLYVMALHDYAKAHWTNRVEYTNTLPIPSFAWIMTSSEFDVTDSNSTFVLDPNLPCSIKRYHGEDYHYDNCTDAMRWTKVLDYDAYIFDVSLLPEQNRTFNSLSEEVWLNQYLSYNSSRNAFPARIDTDVMVFAPNVDNLSAAMQCGLISSPRYAVFGATRIFLEMTTTKDEYGILDISSDVEGCGNTDEVLFPDKNSTYNSWTSSTTFSPITDYTRCDWNTNGDNAACSSQIILSYSSRMVQVAQSSPGISKIDIWLNAGAIVGGIQFFWWFLSIFAAYEVT